MAEKDVISFQRALFYKNPAGPPRGCVERKLEAKLWSEEHEVHMRRSRVGEDA
jgi:hypothetical protein